MLTYFYYVNCLMYLRCILISDVRFFINSSKRFFIKNYQGNNNMIMLNKFSIKTTNVNLFHHEQLKESIVICCKCCVFVMLPLANGYGVILIKLKIVKFIL